MKKSTQVVGSVAAVFFGLASNTVMAKNADDVLGKWKIISHLDGTDKAIVEFRKNKKNNTYYSVILSQKDKRKTCIKCPKPFKGKKIKGMVMVWNAKATKKNPHVYKGGFGINPWGGRMFQGEFKLSRNGDILKVKGYPLETKLVSRSFTWLRVK